MNRCLCGRRAVPAAGVYLRLVAAGRTMCPGCGRFQVHCTCPEDPMTVPFGHEHEWALPPRPGEPEGYVWCRCSDERQVYAFGPDRHIVREVEWISGIGGYCSGLDYLPDGRLVGVWRDLPPHYEPRMEWPA